jgi:signal transduction histidine kinase
MVRYLLLFWLFFIHFFVFAQQQYVYVHYTQNNGLPQNSINDLYWDKNGFLWLSTEEGLVKFDGSSFYTFNVNNTPGLKTDRFRWILKDYKNKIYITTADGRIHFIDNDLLPSPVNSNRYVYIRGILPDQNSFNEILKTLETDSGIKAKSWKSFPTQLLHVENKNYILGSKWIYHVKGSRHLDSFAYDKAIKYAFNIGKYAYAQEGKKIYYIDFASKKLVPIITPLPINDSFKLQLFPQLFNDEIFIECGKKIYLLSSTKNPLELKCEFKLDVSGILTRDISSVVHDGSNQNLAVGSITDGLYLFKPRSFFTLQNSSAKEYENYGYYAHILINDSITLNTYGGELALNMNKKTGYNLNNINPRFLYKDNRDAIWSYRDDSLFYQFKSKKRVAIIIPHYDKIRSMMVYGDSLIAISSNNIFIIRNYKLIATVGLDEAANIANSDEWSCALLQSNTILLGNNRGVYKIPLHPPHTVTKLFDHSNIRFMQQYNNWIIGTSYGDGPFIIYNNQLIKLPVDKQQYLKKSHTLQITPDKNIFISTNNGLFKTTIGELSSYINKKSNTVYYQHFDGAEGIENTEFNGACFPASVALTNGYLSFANMSGLIWFNPKNLPEILPITKRFYVNEIDQDGFPLNISDTIYVNSNTEKLTLKYSFIYWHNKNNIKLEYKLQGYTKEWNEMPDGQSLSFTNLPSGTYSLLIKSRTGFTHNDLSLTQITIIKASKFYETAWFSILMALTGICIVVCIIFLYNKRLISQNLFLEKRVAERTLRLESINSTLQKSEQELLQSVNVKNKLISIISHDIITPLRFISLVSKNLKATKEPTKIETEVIKEIHHTSQRLYDNAQNILNWVRYQNKLISVNKTTVSPYAMVEDLCELFKDVAAMQKNTLVNNVDMDDIIQSDKNILTIILQNILSNAVKYTHSSTITITSSHIEDKYKITVADDGAGISENGLMRIDAIRNKVKTNMFDDSADGTGLGFIIIFELAELMSAEIILSSNANGTSVSIVI